MVDLFSCMLIENCQDGEASIQDAVSREIHILITEFLEIMGSRLREFGIEQP